MRLWSRIKGWVQCLWRGHSRYVVFSYSYRDEPPVISAAPPTSRVIDQTLVARCARCNTVLPSRAVGGVVTLGRYRSERPESKES